MPKKRLTDLLREEAEKSSESVGNEAVTLTDSTDESNQSTDNLA